MNKYKVEVKKGFVLVNERYAIYKDGTIYDTLKSDDIPQWIYDLRETLCNKTI